MDLCLLIGNGIALGAAVFTILSSFSKTRKRIYGYQLVQCLLMAMASVFFHSVSGSVTFLLCAARNGLLMFDRFSGKLCLLFLAVLTVLGLCCNNRGWIGVIPVLTTVLYTIGTYYLKRERLIKGNIAVNLLLWAIYDAIILDLVSCSIDGVSALATLLAIGKVKEEKEAM